MSSIAWCISITATCHTCFRSSLGALPAHLTLPGPKGFATYTFHTTSLLNSLMAFYMWPHMFANFFGSEDARVIQRQAMLIPLYNLITLSFTLVGFAGVLVLQGISRIRSWSRCCCAWLLCGWSGCSARERSRRAW